MDVRAETFRVMDLKGNTINFVGIAEAERPGDNADVRIAKRLFEAQRKCQRWLATHFRSESLVVVPCDILGNPLQSHAHHSQQ